MRCTDESPRRQILIVLAYRPKVRIRPSFRTGRRLGGRADLHSARAVVPICPHWKQFQPPLIGAGSGRVLAEQGSDADPELVQAPNVPRGAAAISQTATARRSYLLPVTLGLSGLGAAAAGVIFHVKREHAARDWNGPNCENPGQTRIGQCQTVDARRQSSERLAIGFYAASGALLTGSLVALVAGRPSEVPRARSGLLGCALDGAGVSCGGRF